MNYSLILVFFSHCLKCEVVCRTKTGVTGYTGGNKCSYLLLGLVCLFEGVLRLKVNFPFFRSTEKRSKRKTLKNCCTTLFKYSVLN